MRRILLLFISFVFLAFTTGDTKSEYILPLRAYSIDTEDIDLDGDEDIVVGHIYDAGTEWSGISILKNEGDGYFELIDSIYLYGGQIDIQIENLNDNPLPEIIAKYVGGNPESEHIVTINDMEFENISYYNLNTTEGVNLITTGDINGDNYMDIIFASNGGQFMGILYNNGSGNFSEPEFHSTQYWPIDLAVGDIDGNGMDDIAIAGQNTVIYYSFDSGFEEYYFTGLEHSVNLKDMDNDGDLDVVTLWGAFVTTVNLYENKGYQDFVKHTVCTVPATSGGILTPDLNNDLFSDITFLSGGNFKYLYNLGGLSFSEMDSLYIEDFTYGLNYSWSDLDQNNYPDISVIKLAGVYVPNLKLLFNDGDGNFGEDPITHIENRNLVPIKPILSCFPIPVKDHAIISFTLSQNAVVSLKIYNLNGILVQTLLENTYRQIGKNSIVFRPKINSGMYFLELIENNNCKQSLKLIIN